MDRWESLAERKIREAIEAGEFDNLPDRGKPLPLEEDPDPAMWMAHHLLRVNGFAPPWIEDGKEIDRLISRLRSDLAHSYRPGPVVEEIRAQAAELNRRILVYNLKCPSARFHKPRVDLEAEIRAAKAKYARPPDRDS